VIAMSQHGQLIQLRRRGREGQALWAFRYRVGGRGSKRVQRGGFASEREAAEALERELERLRREQRVARSLTLVELVEAYLAQHDVDEVTIEKLRWLLGKALAVFGDRPVGELRSEEIAAWRIGLSAGYRFDATQALRQVLARAVLWGMIDVNPGQARRRQPLAAAEGAAPVRVVGRARRGRRESRAPLPADGDIRGRNRAPTSRMARAREARRRLPGTRRLRPPVIHEGSIEMHEDGGEPAGGAAASDRTGRDRTPAVESAQPAALPAERGGYLDLHNFRNREWKPAQRAAGIEPLRRVYDLRHTFATFALRAGISTFDLSR
jgi:integrase